VRYLALDIGEARIGLAISDASGRVASPLAVLPRRDVMAATQNFRRLLAEYEPETLVVGLPVSLSGHEGSQAAAIRAQAREVARVTGLPLVFVDERLSSAEARRILRATGHNERKMRGRTDKIAASLFLQAYLDELHAKTGTGFSVSGTAMTGADLSKQPGLSRQPSADAATTVTMVEIGLPDGTGPDTATTGTALPVDA
jgi:putative Holliday junction resolvase